ncbi:MAG: hypothetical protein NTU53_14860 [Planctomycetota bacterium]|nr:hypothetical protein [Planctomycetota bacterium]
MLVGDRAKYIAIGTPVGQVVTEVYMKVGDKVKAGKPPSTRPTSMSISASSDPPSTPRSCR